MSMGICRSRLSTCRVAPCVTRIFDQVKQQQGMDEKLIVACEILCLSMLRCTEQWHGSEKKGVPDALSLLNVNDTPTSNASHGQFMMGHCWWVGGLSFQETASGVLCWQASTSTFTGATMMRPTDCHIC